jgi:hypothetical protein
MKYDFENPFAGYGNMVTGDRFIGRKHDLSVIDSRVTRDQEGANLAIVGETKTGKSSLAHAATIARKDKLLANNILPIWVNLANYDNATDFYNSLVSLCQDELNTLGWLSDTIKLAAKEALADAVPSFEQLKRRQEFFQRVRTSGKRVIFVLDEFDHARKLFKNSIVNFQRFRDLAYRPEWRVYYITTSRRSIKAIETMSNAISTLTLTFEEHYLGVFSIQDIDEHFDRYSCVNINIPAEVKKQLLFHTGGHPYLLDVIGYQLIEICRERESKEIDFNEGLRRVEYNFLRYFDTLVEYMSESGKLPLLLEALFTKSANYSSEVIHEFIKYGVVKTLPDGRLVGFSDYFHEYMKLVERESDLRSIWGRTEIALRSFITASLEEHYGEEWIKKLEKSNASLKANVLDPCRERQAREERLFKGRASDNLIDFTYPADLFAIIFAEWNLFQPAFGNDKTYWANRVALLGKIRTVIHHYRDEVLTKDQRRIGEGFCEEILRIIESWYGPSV